MAWSAVVVLALVWGGLDVADAGVSLRAAPFNGRWRWDGGNGLVPGALVAPVVVGGAIALAGPRAAAAVRWREMPALAGASAVAWTVALAATDGWHALTEPLTSRHEYEPFAAGIDDIGAFVSVYTEDLASYPIHVQGHPPGPVVLAWGLDRVGLGGAGWLAALSIAGWGVAVAAALIAARTLAGEAAARRAAPALAVLPAAVWAGTSLDGLFAGLTATGCALAVVALVRRAPARAAAAGLVLGLALLCTFGTAAVLVLPAAVAVALLVHARHPAGTTGGGDVRGLVVCGAWGLAGAAGALAGAALAGFWWVDGLRATSEAYWTGVGGLRPGAYLTVAGNPGALAVATGPAVAAGLAVALSRVRRGWRMALLPGVALGAVLVADLSQMSRGEVERIWLPFVPWLALAAPGRTRGWLAVQVAVALVVQSTLSSPW